MEKQIIYAINRLRGKAATWQIAEFIGIRDKTANVLKIMKKLESKGVFKRHSSSKNNIVWVNEIKGVK